MRVKEWVRQCDVCQRNKYDQQLPNGLLQPLPIPTQIWAEISIDFVEVLPKSKGKFVILVVVDRMINMAISCLWPIHIQLRL